MARAARRCSSSAAAVGSWVVGLLLPADPGAIAYAHAALLVPAAIGAVATLGSARLARQRVERRALALA